MANVHGLPWEKPDAGFHNGREKRRKKAKGCGAAHNKKGAGNLVCLPQPFRLSHRPVRRNKQCQSAHAGMRYAHVQGNTYPHQGTGNPLRPCLRTQSYYADAVIAVILFVQFWICEIQKVEDGRMMYVFLVMFPPSPFGADGVANIRLFHLPQARCSLFYASSRIRLRNMSEIKDCGI